MNVLLVAPVVVSVVNSGTVFGGGPFEKDRTVLLHLHIESKQFITVVCEHEVITISIPWFILHVDNVRMKIVLDDIKIDAYFFNIYIFFMTIKNVLVMFHVFFSI